MKNIALIIFTFSFLVTPAWAEISLPWSCTFDCDEWTKDETSPLYANPIVCNNDCDGLVEWGGYMTSCGDYEQITSDANNPSGGGGRGQRHWYGPGNDGENDNSGGLALYFADHPAEIWIRWYMRFPTGLSWSRINYDKLIYLFLEPISADVEIILEWYGSDGFRVAVQGVSGVVSPTANSGAGWLTFIHEDLTAGDDEWHYFEAHLKIDTDGSNGIAEVWIDDVKIINEHSVNFGGLSHGNTGFSHMLIGSNQETVNSITCEPVDFDDISISATGQIGPLDSTPSISAPSGLRVVGGFSWQ